MEPEGSSPHSQANATCPSPELGPSSPHMFRLQRKHLAYVLRNNGFFFTERSC